jgi:hypothetical protein
MKRNVPINIRQFFLRALSIYKGVLLEDEHCAFEESDHQQEMESVEVRTDEYTGQREDQMCPKIERISEVIINNFVNINFAFLSRSDHHQRQFENRDQQDEN